MANKAQPISHPRCYYKTMIEYYKAIRDKKFDKLVAKQKEEELLYNNLVTYKDDYKETFNVDLDSFKEFVQREYINGEFIKFAKNKYSNKNGNYNIVLEYYELYKYTILQKHVHDLKKEIERCDKFINIPIKIYMKVLKNYYYEVHKRMVLDGEGYVFEDRTGWTCINRVYIANSRGCILDYAKTKKRKKEILDAGQKIYNKEEAEYCAEHNIPYDGIDYRVFRKDEYKYEVPLLDCKLPNGTDYELKIGSYRGYKLNTVTMDEFCEMYKDDIQKICSLEVDLKCKVTLATTIDNLLYTKFIRNEGEKSIKTRKTNCED